jgi:hypothetical protein
MKLILNRSQKGPAGGLAVFVLSCRLEVSQSELDLMKRYGQDNRLLGKVEGLYNGYNMAALRKGLDIENGQLAKVLAIEKALQEDCADLINFLGTAVNYLGTEEHMFEL